MDFLLLAMDPPQKSEKDATGIVEIPRRAALSRFRSAVKNCPVSNRNHCPVCAGITVQFAPESVSSLDRNTQNMVFFMVSALMTIVKPASLLAFQGLLIIEWIWVLGKA